MDGRGLAAVYVCISAYRGKWGFLLDRREYTDARSQPVEGETAEDYSSARTPPRWKGGIGAASVLGRSRSSPVGPWMVATASKSQCQ